MSGRPRKVLVGWSELLAWLEGEGVSEWAVKRVLVGEAAPAWRAGVLLGRKRKRFYVVAEVAAWLPEGKRALERPWSQGRSVRGTFTKKLYETQ